MLLAILQTHMRSRSVGARGVALCLKLPQVPFELPHDKTNKMTCAPSEDSDQAWASAQSDQSSLSAWRKVGSLATHWVHSEDWSDWADARPGWSESSLGAQSFCWFCHAAVHLLCVRTANALFVYIRDKYCFSYWLVKFDQNDITRCQV